MTDDELANSEKNLEVLRTLYVISYVIGFRELLKEMPWPWTSVRVVPAILVAVVLTILAIRFFWAVGNIRHFISNVTNWNSRFVGSLIMVIHVPVLLTHSFIFYLLCRSYGIMFDDGAVNNEFDFAVFFLAYIGLLVVNAVWLLFCAMPNSIKDFVNFHEKPRLAWAYNNLAFSLLCVTSIVFLRASCYVPVVFALFALNSITDFLISGHVYVFRRPG